MKFVNAALALATMAATVNGMALPEPQAYHALEPKAEFVKRQGHRGMEPKEGETPGTPDSQGNRAHVLKPKSPQIGFDGFIGIEVPKPDSDAEKRQMRFPRVKAKASEHIVDGKHSFFPSHTIQLVLTIQCHT
jgi:hypothetical protein